MMKKGRYGRFVKFAITCVDFVLLNTLFLVMFLTKFGTPGLYNLKVLVILNISYLIAILLNNDIHERRIVYADKIALIALRVLATDIALFLAFLWVADTPEIDTLPIVFYFSTFYILLSVWWLASRQAVKLYRAHGFNFKRVIIIGSGKTGIELLEEMLTDAGYGYRLMGFFDDKKYAKSVKDYKGTINDVEQFVKENPIDEMYCTIADDDQNIIERLINIAECNAVDFYFVPQLGSKLIRRFELNEIGNFPALSVRPNPLNRTINKLIKRVFDILFSLTFLIISPVIFIPVAIAIKMSSPGPVFFKQRRTGYRGKEFVCYKFRTMKVNNDSDNKQASKNDPRKTKIGNILRKTNIDELPQFYNVLKGEMSIVGPRPHMVKQTEDYSALIDKYMLRHIIKPGITGWAQVNGFRGETKELWQMQKRVEYDVWYAENWNFMLDIKIIIKTIINAIRGDKNAF